MVELFSSIDYDKFYDEIGEEVSELKSEVENNSMHKEKVDNEDYKKSFGGIQLKYDAEYNMDGKIHGVKLTKSGGVANMNNGLTAKYLEKQDRYEAKKKEKGHKETYYSQKNLPGKGLNIPGRHVAKDGTIRDQDGYICVACNYLPKKSLIMTTRGPGRVYDRGGMKGNWIDLYTNW